MSTYEEYQEIFVKAQNYFKNEAPFVDSHGLAHQVVEYFYISGDDVESICDAILVKNTCILPEHHSTLINNPSCNDISNIEKLLDLGRLYIESIPELEFQERFAFLQIMHGEDCDENSFNSLVEKLRNRLYATITQEIVFEFCYGQSQIQENYGTSETISERNRRLN